MAVAEKSFGNHSDDQILDSIIFHFEIFLPEGQYWTQGITLKVDFLRV